MFNRTILEKEIVAESARMRIKDRKDDQLIQDWNLDVNFDQQEMLIYEHIDKQQVHESFPANWNSNPCEDVFFWLLIAYL